MTMPLDPLVIPDPAGWPMAWSQRSDARQQAGRAVLAAFLPFLDDLAAHRTPATVAQHRANLFHLGGLVVAFLAADPRNAAKGMDWWFQHQLPTPPIPPHLQRRKAELASYRTTCRALLRFHRKRRLGSMAG